MNEDKSNFEPKDSTDLEEVKNISESEDLESQSKSLKLPTPQNIPKLQNDPKTKPKLKLKLKPISRLKMNLRLKPKNLRSNQILTLNLKQKNLKMNPRKLLKSIPLKIPNLNLKKNPPQKPRKNLRLKPVKIVLLPLLVS